MKKTLIESDLLPNLQQKIEDHAVSKSVAVDLKEAVRLELFPTQAEKDRKEYLKLADINKEKIALASTKPVI